MKLQQLKALLLLNVKFYFSFEHILNTLLIFCVGFLWYTYVTNNIIINISTIYFLFFHKLCSPFNESENPKMYMIYPIDFKSVVILKDLFNTFFFILYLILLFIFNLFLKSGHFRICDVFIYFFFSVIPLITLCNYYFYKNLFQTYNALKYAFLSIFIISFISFITFLSTKYLPTFINIIIIFSLLYMWYKNHINHKKYIFKEGD